MATLTPTLTLTSTDASSDSLSVTVTDSLTVGAPSVNVARQSVATSGQFNILTAADNTGITYVYVKNTDTTNVVTLKDDSANNFLDLSPGEFAFFPVKGGIGLEATANTAACVLEYAFWTKS
jgi:subtilase family serine protease